MKRAPRHRAASALALAGACYAAPSVAQTPATEPTHFELRAPEGCSSLEDFAARVRRRSSRISLTAAPARRSLLVQIRERGAGVLVGTVRVVEPGVRPRSRQLKASSCAEAVDALSLIATVTLDPDALSAEPESAAESKPEPKPEAPPAPKPEPAPTPAALPEPRARRPTPPSHAAGPEPAYRVSVGAGVALLFNQAPLVAPGGWAALALELRPGRVVSPFLRLSLVHAQRRNVVAPGGFANFAFTLPTLDVCPVRLGPRALGVRPCVYGSLGWLEAWGSASVASESHGRLAGAGGASLWLGARISEAFEIIADGRVGAAFPRDRFAFDERSFFTTPTLGFSAGLGVAGGFP